MAVRPSAEATELALTRLMRACPDGEAFRQEAIGLLRRAAGFDGWCWARFDSRSRLPAHGSLADGGHLVCYRDLPGSLFTDDQAALMRMAAPLLGAHMREGWRRGSAGLRIEDEPGTLVFDAGLALLSATQAALRWLKALDWPTSWGLPAFVYALAARAADTRSSARIRVRALRGGWASLHAAPLLPATAAGSVVVTIGPPAPAEVADMLMRAWELSPRERQIAAAIVSGQGTRQAARALEVSEHTVRQHVKAVFAKVGVHSRDHLRDVLTGGLR